jgi:hypothetical protein
MIEHGSIGGYGSIGPFRHSQSLLARGAEPALKETLMKQTLIALLATGTIAVSLAATATDASAQRGSFATGAAVGVVGGLLLGSAIANSRPAYGGPVAVVPAQTCVREEQHWSNRRQAWVIRQVRFAC